MSQEWNDPDNAILILQTTIKSFPDSWKAYNALAETQLLRGDTAEAVTNFRKSFDLNRQNETAKEMLEQLSGG